MRLSPKLFRDPSTVRRAGAVVLGLAAVAFFLWLQHSDLRIVQQLRGRLEWLAYDQRFDTLPPFTLPEDPAVVIVDIDERSLAAEGHWPWPRQKLATLLSRLFEGGAAVVGFDMVFPEPEPDLARAVRERFGPGADNGATVLRRLEALPGDDDRLATALGRGESVLGYMLAEAGTRKGEVGKAIGRLPDGTVGMLRRFQGHVGNIPVLQDAALSAGFLTVFPDGDGVMRRYHLLAERGGRLYPSLALEAVRRYLLLDSVGVATTPIGGRTAVDHLDFGGRGVATDGEGAVLVPFHGRAGTFPSISATDLLAGTADADAVAGKVVLVGATAQGLFDNWPTPVQTVFPGVEVHANVIQGLLSGDLPYRPAWADGANFVILLGLGLLLAAALPRLRPLPLAAVTLGGLAALVGANLYLWAGYRWVLPVALPALLVLTLGALNMGWGYLMEERSRRRLRSIFGQYVPPEVVGELMRTPDGVRSMAGERREMSVLFADIRGFSAMAERLSPAEVKDLLNRVFTPVTEAIFERRGTVDKYVGDMVMAFWGAPLADPDHAADAVAAALAMRARVAGLKEEFAALGYPGVELGIGINTGEMSVGNMGSEYRRAYTVVGDAVNIASRLEGLTRFYGVGVLVGEETRRRAGDGLAFRVVDRVRVKGRTAPLTIYTPLGAADRVPAAGREEADRLEAALDALWRGELEEADAGLRSLAAARPGDPLYRIHLERVERLQSDGLPPDWDGTFEHREK